jgi:hypothetical protein
MMSVDFRQVSNLPFEVLFRHTDGWFFLDEFVVHQGTSIKRHSDGLKW